MFRTHSLAAAALLALISLAPAQAQTAAPAPAMATPATGAPAAAKAAASTADSAPAAESSEGKLAYYGSKFSGRRTASGQAFNPSALTMAHKSLPFGSMVKVTNLANKRSVVVRVNDRGPSQADRVGDVSLAAARALRMTRAGVINAKLEVVGMAKMGKQAKMSKMAKKA